MHCVENAKRELCTLPLKQNLARRPRQMNPTGKSIPIYGNSVKLQIKKYFAFPEGQISDCIRPSRPGQKGVGRRHGRWAGCDGRWFTSDDGVDLSVRQNRVVLAPVAGVKLLGRREPNGGDGVNPELVSGESAA